MECIWPLEAMLGEGPLWDAEAETLWFVDIKQGRVHSCDPQGKSRRTLDIGGSPSFILPETAGGFAIGNGHTLLAFDGADSLTTIEHVPMPRNNRINDATTDGFGRLWFGSMDDDEKTPNGALYVRDSGLARIVGGECVIANGPAITADCQYLYHVDTLKRLILRYTIAEGAALEDERVFVRIEETAGWPDGVTIDAEDHVWVGLWGGWAARRYAPDGRLVAEIRFPCANVTKLAFGGGDLKTAFATTARIGLSRETIEEQPLAGGVFRFEVEVPGVITPPARISR